MLSFDTVADYGAVDVVTYICFYLMNNILPSYKNYTKNDVKNLVDLSSLI